jgi:uncharacterized protein YdeI (YjbR/CyaY-like superfamily)
MAQDYETLMFETKAALRVWLEANHATCPGIWLRFAKKKSALKTVTYEEAVELALCFGWIDSMARSLDDESYIQKFTPRKAKSIWSKVNCAKAEALIKCGEMHPAGLAAIEAARADGRWEAAYDSPSTASVPEDLQRELDKNPAAAAFFAGLNGANRYAVLWRLQTAKKAETRARRLENLVGMLERGEKLHP